MSWESASDTESVTGPAGSLITSLVKDHAQHVILYLAGAIQLGAAVLIALAAAQATFRSLVIFFRRDAGDSATDDVRLRLGRWLVLALEFQVAADILRTTVAPTWNEIGQLASIIVLRTVLNFFLQKEIEKAAESRSGKSV